MRSKRRNILCVLITLLVFVSGMYFENIKIDSDFAYIHAEKENTCILPVNCVLTDTQACTTEMLGIRGDISMVRAVANLRRDVEISGDFLCQNLFSLQEKKSEMSFEKSVIRTDTREKLVVNYIHKSDGKKEI